MKKNIILSLCIIIFCLSIISFVESSTSMTANPTAANLDPGNSAQVTISYSIINPLAYGGQNGVTVSGSFITSSTNSLPYNANTTTTGNFIVNINVPQNTSSGDYTGSITTDGTTLNIPIHVNELPQSKKCRIYTLPGSFSKTLEAGTQGTQSRDVYISQYCSSALTISTNSPQQTKPISFEQMDGTVEPGQKFSMKVNYDTSDVSRGVYTDSISVSGVDDEENIYTLNLPITLTVTGQISPNINYSDFTSPVCTFSATDLNIDSKYTIICDEINPNADIGVDVDTKYIKGVGVEETSSQYKYTFKPIAVGNTVIEVLFKYKGSTMNSISKEVRILRGNSPVSGTKLKFVFYPTLEKALPSENISILVIDNSTGSEVNEPTIKLDGIVISGTNKIIFLVQSKNYELRASAYGYEDLITNITITKQNLNCTVPSAAYVGQGLTITNPDNATIYLDGSIVNNPLTVNSEGNHSIKCIKDGYLDQQFNLTATRNLGIKSNPLVEDLKTGNTITVELTEENLPWRVQFQNLNGDTPKEIATGLGNPIKFKLSEAGNYYLYNNDKLISQYNVPKSSFWKPWMWWGVGILVILGIGFFMFRNKETGDSGVGFEMTPRQ